MFWITHSHSILMHQSFPLRRSQLTFILGIRKSPYLLPAMYIDIGPEEMRKIIKCNQQFYISTCGVPYQSRHQLELFFAADQNISQLDNLCLVPRHKYNPTRHKDSSIKSRQVKKWGYAITQRSCGFCEFCSVRLLWKRRTTDAFIS